MSAFKSDTARKEASYHMLLINDDARQQELGKLLREQGYVVTAADGWQEGDYDAILLPVAASSDYIKGREYMIHSGQYVFGCNISQCFTNVHMTNGTQIHVVEYMESDAVAYKNAVATAEGAIATAIMDSAVNLAKSNSIVIGYGRCGKILCQKLKGMDANVSVQERKKDKRAEAEAMGYEAYDFTETMDWSKYDYIFNTVPALVLTEQELRQTKSDAVIIDIASKPGGIDYEYCRQHHIKAKLVPGLPGKYAPKTSAEILLEVIESSME